MEIESANENKLPILYLAYFDGKLVGAGELKLRELDVCPEYQFWLDGVFVKPSYRGKGISTKLIEFGISTANSLGLNRLHLRAADYNVKLYEKFGFRTVDFDSSKKSIMELKLINEEI